MADDHDRLTAGILNSKESQQFIGRPALLLVVAAKSSEGTVSLD